MKRNFWILMSCVVLFALLLIVGAVFFMFRVSKGDIRVADVVSDPMATAPMKKADPTLISKPLDPWSIDPVPVEIMYLVLPLTNEENVVTETGFDLSQNIQESMAFATSRDMGVMRGGYTRGLLERITPYSPTGEFELTEQAVQDVIKFVKPTHIVGGTYKEIDGNWQASIYLEQEENKWEETFTAPQGNVIQIRNDVLLWMIECGVFTVPESQKEFIGLFPYGENVMKFEGELYEEMCSNPMHEEWERLEQVYGKNSYHQYYRLYAAMNSGNNEMVKELISKPLDETASFYELLSRIVGFSHLKKMPESVHEREMMMALYPGIFGQAKRYVYNTFSSGQKRELYLHSVNQWYSRVAQYPLAGVMRGDAYYEATYDYRGTGFVNTVPQSSWEKIYEYGAKGMESFSSAIETSVPDPYVVGRLISLNEVLGGGGLDSKQLLESTSTSYPDSTYPMDCLLNFTMPRWGNSIESGMQMIDDAMARRPNNHAFGKFAIRFHELEAQIYTEYSNLDYIKEYFVRFPERKYQYIDSFERLNAKGSPDYLVAYGLSVAAMLEDQSLIQKALVDHPGVAKSLNIDTAYFNWLGKTRLNVVYGCLIQGQWEELRDLLEVIRSEDEVFRDKGDWRSVTFNDPWGFLNAYEAFAQAMTGDVDAGIEKLESLKLHKDRMIWLPYIRAHFNRMEQVDLDALTEYQAKEPQSVKPYYIRALYLLKQGKRDEALKEIDATKGLTGDPWVVVSNEVMELLEESQEVKVSE